MSITLFDIETKATEAYEAQFDREPGLVASAPGRVNLIGEHTDYNQGFVLPCAIDRRVAVAMDRGTAGLYSADFGELQPLTSQAREEWVAYPLGVASALRDSGYEVAPFQAAFAGNVPIAAGLSSSAAIECATAVALDRLGAFQIPRKRLALLCQRAENEYLGVNSGIMDQYASLFGRPGVAILLDCRSLESSYVPIDLAAHGLSLFVCDTRVRRGLAGTAYNERRAACERAAKALGLESLRDATEADLDRLHGEELRRARHVVTENARVLAAADYLREGDFVEFGRLMNLSHISLRDDYEVSIPELDTFVELAIQHGALGARLTGAGFGGCAISLIARDRTQELAVAVRARFADEGFTEPAFYNLQPADGAEVR